jgi:hypothetical protein
MQLMGAEKEFEEYIRGFSFSQETNSKPIRAKAIRITLFLFIPTN